MKQEGIVPGPTTIQQDRIPQQQHVEIPVVVPVPMTQEDDEDIEEDDASPRAPYVGRWCDLMSEDEGDEGHEGDAGEPR